MKKPSAFSLIELSVVILIIGILIAGVTQGSRLIKQFKLSSASSLTRSSSISSIPNLTLWLETTLEESVTSATNGISPSNNDTISNWNDLNPQTVDSKKIVVSQGTAASQPLYIANGIGGLPSIYFDGVNDFLKTATGANVPIGAGDDTYTMITVWKYDSNAANGNRSVIYEGDAAASTNKTAVLYISSTNTAGFVGANNNYFPTNVTKGTSYITTMRINSTVSTNNISLFFNSKSADNGTSGSPSSLDIDGSSFEIGAALSGTGLQFQGLISEIIIFDRNLKNSEITEIQDYLSKKYSIALN